MLTYLNNIMMKYKLLIFFVLSITILQGQTQKQIEQSLKNLNEFFKGEWVYIPNIKDYEREGYDLKVDTAYVTKFDGVYRYDLENGILKPKTIQSYRIFYGDCVFFEDERDIEMPNFFIEICFSSGACWCYEFYIIAENHMGIRSSYMKGQDRWNNYQRKEDYIKNNY